MRLVTVSHLGLCAVDLQERTLWSCREAEIVWWGGLTQPWALTTPRYCSERPSRRTHAHTHTSRTAHKLGLGSGLRSAARISQPARIALHSPPLSTRRLGCGQGERPSTSTALSGQSMRHTAFSTKRSTASCRCAHLHCFFSSL
jgi:hypothetical protein